MNRTILRVTWLDTEARWGVVRGTTVGFRHDSRDEAEAFALDYARELQKGLVRIEGKDGSVERVIRF